MYIDSPYGVSGCHLQVGFDVWGQVVVKDKSKLGCKLTYTKIPNTVPAEQLIEQIARSEGNKSNPPPWVIPVGWTVSIEMGDCGSSLIFQVPDHSDYIEEYRRKVREFTAAQNNPISLLGGLALNSQRATTRGLFTEAQRAALAGKKGRYAWIISGRTLGEGTFGEVLEVFNTTNWCMCAGKRMKTEMTFQNEAGVLKRLQHKNVVQYIDVEEKRPTTPSMIIMEYYPLGDLRKQHRMDRFSQSAIIEIIAQASSALAYLHERTITHRDLKPANILVRSRKPVEIALTDFGVAKSEESVMSTYLGTYPYMAPEVVSNNPDTSQRYAAYTNRVDIWSLGVVAIEMLIGGLPKSVSDLHDQSYARNIYLIRDKLLARCENRKFAALVKEMLEWSQYDRPSAAECFQRASSMVSVAQDAAIGQATQAGRRRGKDPAEGVSSGSAASTVRVMKRVGSDMSTVKPPSKKPSAARPSTKPSAAGPPIKSSAAGPSTKPSVAGPPMKPGTAGSSIRPGAAGSSIRPSAAGAPLKSSAAGPSTRLTAAGPSTKRDPSRELSSLLRHELDNELGPASTKSGGLVAGRSVGGGTCSTPNASLWRELGTAPPTKSSKK